MTCYAENPEWKSSFRLMTRNYTRKRDPVSDDGLPRVLDTNLDKKGFLTRIID